MPTNFQLKFLFAICLAWFLYRGPYRAVHYSTTGDFSTVYAAARCWLHGANPYDRSALKRELASAGAPPDLQRDQDLNPSVYMPGALPWLAPFAALSWKAANTGWCLLSLGLFAASLFALLELTVLDRKGRWLAASAVLLFSPTYVGLYDGNPGVTVISLITLAVCAALRRHTLACGLLFGISLCFKPQLAFCALCVLLLWKQARPLAVGCATFLLATAVGWLGVSHGGRSSAWFESEQRNVAASFAPGGSSDPAPKSAIAWQLLNAQTLASYVSSRPPVYNALVWGTGAVCAGTFGYFWRRKRMLSPWQELAFCAALTLMVSYHRYYDGQLLLLAIPLLARFGEVRRRPILIAIALCLLALTFPIQSIFARSLGAKSQVPSIQQAVLLRNQPTALLLLTLLLSAPLA